MKKSFEQYLENWADDDTRPADQPSYYAGQCRLMRLSNYIFDYTRKRIVRAPDAQVEWYRPFDHEPQLLREYLESMAAVRTARDAEDRAILGNMARYLTNELPRNESEKQTLIKKTRDFIKSIPNPSTYFIEKEMSITVGIVILTPTLENKFRERFEHDLPYILDFLRRYGRVSSLESREEGAARNEYNNYGRVRGRHASFEDYLKSRDDTDAESIPFPFPWYRWRDTGTGEYEQWSSEPYDMLQLLSVDLSERQKGFLHRYLFAMRAEANIGLTKDNRSYRIDYYVKNLRSALRVMLFNIFTSGKDHIKKCALNDCSTFFFTRDMRANYCCPEHSQRGRVRKYREKQKAAAAKPVGKTVGKPSAKR
jgi:hypothetical protein